MNISISLLAAFILYLAVMLGVGFYFSKKSSNVSDYFLGGRQMGSWLTALSAQASDMSSWLLMGLPGAVYISGLGEAWIAIGLAIGTYLNWLFVAKRLRKYSEVAGDAITIPEYLQNRFSENSSALRVVCAIVIFVFFLIYTASGFNATGKLINTVFGVDYEIGLIIGALVIVVYTFLGGYFAVVWTDFFQGMLMFCALMLVPIILWATIGSDAGEILTSVPDNPQYMSLIRGSDGNLYSWQYILSNVGWGLGYFGMPHILVRFMSIKSSSMIKKSRIIAIVWVLITLFASVAIGFLGYAYMAHTGMEIFADASTSETVFMVLVQKLLPAFLAGIFLCAIVAATMSSSDSQMLVTASALTNDIYKTVFKKNATDKELLFLSKIAVVVIAVIAYIMAMDPNNSVMGLVSYAWAGLGAAFGPTMIMSLFWRRMTMSGALAGMISGGLTVVVWKNFFKDTLLVASDGSQLYELIPGFIISLLFIVVVSLISKAPSKKIVEDFDKVKTIEV